MSSLRWGGGSWRCEGVASIFFLNLFNHEEHERLFAQFTQIQNRGQGNALFTFLSQKSWRSLPTVLREFGQQALNELQFQGECLDEEFFPTKIPLSVLERQALLNSIQFFSQSPSPPDHHQLEEFITYLSSINHSCGEEIAAAFCHTIVACRISFEKGIRVAKQLAELGPTLPIEELDSLKDGKWAELVGCLNQASVAAFSWPWGNEERVALMKRSSQMPFPLSPASLEVISEQLSQIRRFCLEYVREPIALLKKNIHALGEVSPNEKRLRLLAIGTCGLLHHRKFILHPTQLLAILGLLPHNRGAFAQVNTGEGKSAIIALFAFLLAAEGHNVHIVTSDQELAKRSQGAMAPFFSSFEITSSHISTEAPPSSAFQSQVMYGTASDFEFAVMREMLDRLQRFQEPICHDEKPRFDSIIVDEADNLTIDTLHNAARIALPSDSCFDWIYTPILSFVKNNRKGTVNELRNFLCHYQKGNFAQEVATFSDEQLEGWRSAASIAYYDRKENHDYVIVESEKGKKACIVDAGNTDRLMHGCRWSGGIHEFIETKHSLAVERESLTPLSLSHPVYYQMYRRLYGFTGTLGSEEEREELRTIYGVETFDVPPYRPSKRQDAPPLNCGSVSSLLKKVLQNAKQCQANGRPLLILCESIHFSQEVSAFLEEADVAHELLNEVQEAAEALILAKAKEAGAITVATNTAARGTDITLTPASITNGGLHVLITFFPKSLRVEQQARGRAGRQGQPGSSAVIFASTDSVETWMARRALQVRLNTQLNCHIAQLARFQFAFVRQFFSQFGSFCDHREAMIDQLAATWTPRSRLRQNPIDLSQLPRKERVIVTEGLALLDGTPANLRKWKTFLGVVHKRVKERILHDWAGDFYRNSERLMSISEIQGLLMIKEMVEYATPVAGIIDLAIHSMIRETMDQVRATFERRNAFWSEYLNPNGSGINQYLKNVFSGQCSWG